jgi:hypothetical protein
MSKITVADEVVMNKIYVTRSGESKVMIDRDLAELYGRRDKAVLNQSSKKEYAERFPKDFMFQMTKGELADLRNHKLGYPIRRKWV